MRFLPFSYIPPRPWLSHQPTQTKPNQKQAKPSQARSGQARPNNQTSQIKQTIPNQTELKQTKPNQNQTKNQHQNQTKIKQNQTKPNQPKRKPPNQTESNQLKLNHIGIPADIIYLLLSCFAASSAPSSAPLLQPCMAHRLSDLWQSVMCIGTKYHRSEGTFSLLV